MGDQQLEALEKPIINFRLKKNDLFCSSVYELGEDYYSIRLNCFTVVHGECFNYNLDRSLLYSTDNLT